MSSTEQTTQSDKINELKTRFQNGDFEKSFPADKWELFKPKEKELTFLKDKGMRLRSKFLEGRTKQDPVYQFFCVMGDCANREIDQQGKMKPGKSVLKYYHGSTNPVTLHLRKVHNIASTRRSSVSRSKTGKEEGLKHAIKKAAAIARANPEAANLKNELKDAIKKAAAFARANPDAASFTDDDLAAAVLDAKHGQSMLDVWQQQAVAAATTTTSPHGGTAGAGALVATPPTGAETAAGLHGPAAAAAYGMTPPRGAPPVVDPASQNWAAGSNLHAATQSFEAFESQVIEAFAAIKEAQHAEKTVKMKINVHDSLQAQKRAILEGELISKECTTKKLRQQLHALMRKVVMDEELHVLIPVLRENGYAVDEAMDQAKKELKAAAAAVKQAAKKRKAQLKTADDDDDEESGEGDEEGDGAAADDDDAREPASKKAKDNPSSSTPNNKQKDPPSASEKPKAQPGKADELEESGGDDSDQSNQPKVDNFDAV